MGEELQRVGYIEDRELQAAGILRACDIFDRELCQIGDIISKQGAGELWQVTEMRRLADADWIQGEPRVFMRCRQVDAHLKPMMTDIYGKIDFIWTTLPCDGTLFRLDTAADCIAAIHEERVQTEAERLDIKIKRMPGSFMEELAQATEEPPNN